MRPEFHIQGIELGARFACALISQESGSAVAGDPTLQLPGDMPYTKDWPLSHMSPAKRVMTLLTNPS